LKADAKTKDEEVSDKQAEIFKKGEQVQNKKDEHTATQKNWRELNITLKAVQDRIVKIEAVLAAEAAAASVGAPPPSPVSGATPENLAKGKIKEKELEDDIKVLDAKLLTLLAEIPTLESEKLKLDGDLPTLQNEYKTILTDQIYSRIKKSYNKFLITGLECLATITMRELQVRRPLTG
jgi:DNA repair exonuclease SbcCD ATPase subunit